MQPRSDKPSQRRRLPRDVRRRQLLDTAWQLVREEGTEALTLGRLASQAGVTKPVVYDHFGARPGLLAAMYREYDARQNELLDAALETRRTTPIDTARVISSSYVDCVLRQGKEVTGVIAALAGSPELEEVKREYETAFMVKCRMLLTPFVGSGVISAAGLWAMLGAAEALSSAAAGGAISAAQARDELSETVLSMVARSVVPERVGTADADDHRSARA